MAETLIRNGLDTQVVSGSRKLLDFAKDRKIPAIKSWWWKKQNWSGANVLIFPVYLLWQVVLYFYYLVFFIREKADVVHLQSKDDFIAGTLAAKTLRLKVIWTDHADLKHIWLNIRKWYKNPVGKLVYASAFLADKITVVSESEKELVSANLNKQSKVLSKIIVIYNGAIDTGVKKVKDNDKFVFTCTSRLVKDKGIAELIKAYLSISSSKTELWIIGDGDDKNIFKKLAGNNKSIIFHGHVGDVSSYLDKSSAFVHPTYHEGFSLALVEAGMKGLPTIATDVGGNPEIIKDGHTGILVKPKDVESLSRAMKTLLDNKELRSELSKNSRKQYELRFNFETIIKRNFMPLYEEDKK